MVLKIIIVVLIIAAIWAVAEYLLYKLHRDNEDSRKLVHVLHGVGLAVLAFVIPLWAVAAFELLVLLVVLLGRFVYAYKLKYIGPLQYLGKLYRVGRPTYGDFLYPTSVILTALIANTKWEFAAALLILALADSAAALVGKRYGRATTYTVFGQKKSLAGSAAFFVTSVVVVAWYLFLSGVAVTTSTPSALLWVPLLLTVTENLGIYGSDNLLIPLVAVVALNSL